MAQDKLLDIAVAEFAAKGLDGASTRGIAAAAGTAMSAITYHFGGKEGLYLAAADHIAARMATDMEAATKAEAAIAANDPDAAAAAIRHILARLADKMVVETNGDGAVFMLREQMNPSAAFDRIYGGVMREMVETVADLVRVATGLHDPQAARVATLTLFGQVTMLRGSRATCLRLLGLERFSPEALAAIKTRITANTDAILARLYAEARGTS